MTTHIFGMILTQEGTFSNNRGEGEGTTANLQKVFRDGDQWSTVSAEAIRYALRESWQQNGEKLNRKMPDHTRSVYSDSEFKDGEWQKRLDDDLLGFMRADKSTLARRAPLEVTRAISITPWRGETMHNFASPGTNLSSDYEENHGELKLKDNASPHPYAVEVHHTRYQFGFALTPDALGREGNTGQSKHKSDEIKNRVEKALMGLVSLRRVGGAHARYFADYSAAVIVLRVTTDPAPRFLYCFEQDERDNIGVPRLAKMAGDDNTDILANELIVGATIPLVELDDLRENGVVVKDGAKAAVNAACEKVEKIKNQSHGSENTDDTK